MQLFHSVYLIFVIVKRQLGNHAALKKTKKAGNEPKEPKVRGRQWKPLFLRSAGIYAPDVGRSGDREIHNVIFTTTVPYKHGSSTRGQMSTDATMKRDGTSVQ